MADDGITAEEFKSWLKVADATAQIVELVGSHVAGEGVVQMLRGGVLRSAAAQFSWAHDKNPPKLYVWAHLGFYLCEMF